MIGDQGLGAFVVVVVPHEHQVNVVLVEEGAQVRAQAEAAAVPRQRSA